MRREWPAEGVQARPGHRDLPVGEHRDRVRLDEEDQDEGADLHGGARLDGARAQDWDHFAIGTAISGITLVCGEKVCGIDPQLVLDKDGKVKSSPEMDRRIETSRRYHEGFGEILVQMNVEDTRFGVAEYVLNEYGLDAIELKWGQGRAQELKRRGYIVTPDPTHDRGRDHRPDQGHPDCSAERGDERRPDDYDRVRDRRQARGRQEDGRRDARRDGRRRQVLKPANVAAGVNPVPPMDCAGINPERLTTVMMGREEFTPSRKGGLPETGRPPFLIVPPAL